MDKELESLSLSQLIDFKQENEFDNLSAVYERSCMVAHNLEQKEFSETLFLERPTRMNMVLTCLCLKGDLIIQSDMQQCNIHENSLFICKPGTIFQFIKGKLDLFSVLMVDTQYQVNSGISIQKLLPHYDELEKLTVIQLKPEEAERMNNLIGYLKENINDDRDKMFYHEGVRTLQTTVSYEVLRHFSRNLKDNNVNAPTAFSRQHVYFREFTNLLGIHFREERRVEYYAEKLHITPKYLGTLVMQHTGRPASHWISLYVMSEAKALLLNTAMSIQEVAFSLNFPNQSFFGKYFKSHQGVTPGEFRKQKGKKSE